MGKLLAPLGSRPNLSTHDPHSEPLSLLLRSAAPRRRAICRLRDPVRGAAWNAADGHTASVYAALSLGLKLTLFLPFGLYSRLWRHAGVPDMAKIIEAPAP